MKRISHTSDLEALLTQTRSLSDIEFAEVNWSRVDAEDLCELHFDHCTFENNSCRDAKFETLELTDCTFITCGFDSASIKETKFNGCVFYDKETERSCSFKFAQFDDVSFKHCDLTMANFSRANLYRVTLNQCPATGIDFSYASTCHQVGNTVMLTDAWINHCNMSYADFRGAKFNDCDLSGNRFSHSVLDHACFENTLLNDSDFHAVTAEGLSIKGADLRDAQISGLDIRAIDMTGVRFNGYQQRILLEAIGLIID
jgi:fluoroquinolone resistance protein|tara:strand:- start:69 stop:839 length:771 start_codon:yes stop_codon:yes gene_type:complete